MQKTITIPAGKQVKFSQIMVGEAFICVENLLYLKEDSQFGRVLSGTDDFGTLVEFKQTSLLTLPPYSVQPELQALKSLFAKET